MAGASTLFLNTKELRADGVRIVMDVQKPIYYIDRSQMTRPDEGLQRLPAMEKHPFKSRTAS